MSDSVSKAGGFGDGNDIVENSAGLTWITSRARTSIQSAGEKNRCVGQIQIHSSRCELALIDSLISETVLV